jgi:hypothetical protein
MMSKLETAIALIDEANSKDPNQETDNEGKSWPKESLYSFRMSDMLQRYRPDADDAIIIGVRAQHVERWKSSRQDYAQGRQGYLQWRANLYKFHAETAGNFMAEAGYDEETIERVKKAVGKRAVKVNPDAQMLEDVASMVFLEYYMQPFADKHPEYSEEKWIDIIQKTWKKMSDQAHHFVLDGNVTLPEPLVPVIQKALS